MSNSTAAQPLDLDRNTIREIFMRHGFTIKDGQTDLKPYVYEAAEALIAQARTARLDTTSSASIDTPEWRTLMSDYRYCREDHAGFARSLVKAYIDSRATLAPVAAQQAAAQQGAVECDSALRAEPASRVLSAVADLTDDEIQSLCFRVVTSAFIAEDGDVDYLRYDAAVVRAVVTELAARCRAEGGNTSNNEVSDLAAKAPAAQAIDARDALHQLRYAISFRAACVIEGDPAKIAFANDKVWAAHEKAGEVLAASPASTPEASRQAITGQCSVCTNLEGQLRVAVRQRDQALASQQAAAVAAPSDEQIEASLKAAGGRWEGSYWIIEDADLHPFVRSIAAAVAATTSENARDAARLDFLGGPAVVSMNQYEPSEGAVYISIDLDLPGSPTVRGATLREAIDAALRATQQEGGK